jgi:hypothetical protein
MATINPEDSNEMFAGVYERLREHEKVLIELLIDVKALCATLRADQLSFFEQEKEKTLHESAFATERNLNRYSEIIARLRGSQ